MIDHARLIIGDVSLGWMHEVRLFSSGWLVDLVSFDAIRHVYSDSGLEVLSVWVWRASALL
jgi:hypothetical protein